MPGQNIVDFTFRNRKHHATDSDTAVRDKVTDVAYDAYFAVKEIRYHQDVGDKKVHADIVKRAIDGIQFVLGVDYGLAIDEEDYKEYVEHLRDVKKSLEASRDSGWEIRPIYCINPIVYFEIDEAALKRNRRMSGLPIDIFEFNGVDPKPVPEEPPADSGDHEEEED